MAIQEEEEEEEEAGGERRKDRDGSDSGEVARSTAEASSRASSTTGGGGLRRAASKRLLHSSQGQRSSRGSSRGAHSSQVQVSVWCPFVLARLSGAAGLVVGVWSHDALFRASRAQDMCSVEYFACVLCPRMGWDDGANTPSS